MLAARDQENLVYNQQTTTARKPLNRGPKESKTPSAHFLNHDAQNRNARGTKSIQGMKSNGLENIQLAKPNAGKSSKSNAFVTPSGNQKRAPLGVKTTNAKTIFREASIAPSDVAKKQQPSKSQPRPESSSSRKSKLQAIRSNGVESGRPVVDTSDGERDVEYMPPRDEPLPDYPEELDPELDFSMLNPANLKQALFRYYRQERNDDDLTAEQRYERKFKEDSDALDEMIDREWERQQCGSTGGHAERTLKSARTPLLNNQKPRAMRQQVTVDRGVNVSGPRKANDSSKLPPRLGSLASRRPLPAPASTSASSATGRFVVSAQSAKPLVSKTKTVEPQKLNKKRLDVPNGTISYSKGRSVSQLLKSESKRNGGSGQISSRAPNTASTKSTDQAGSDLSADELDAIYSTTLAADETEVDDRMQLSTFSQLLREGAEEDFQLNFLDVV